jgi:calcineurin-like phosphoesterase family protein
MVIEDIFKTNPWVISDIHFFHKNIIKLTNRTEDWQDKFIKTWNETILPNEMVFIGGDMFMGTKRQIRELLETTPLNGRKYLLIGNHDGYTDNFYESIGITPIRNYLDCFGDKKRNALIYQNIIISHFPIVPIPEGYLNIHGHVHNNPFPQKEVNHINMSIELLDYKPVRFNDLLRGANECQ